MEYNEIISYLAWCKRTRAAPRFKGHGPFEALWNSGLIVPDYTAIRILYTGVKDRVYLVNENGMFVLAGAENSIPLKPADVLSEETNPDGWEPEGLRPEQLLKPEEMKKEKES